SEICVTLKLLSRFGKGVVVNFRNGVSDATLVERGFKTVLSFKLLFAIGETLSGLLLFLFNNKAFKHSFSPK
ncbi:hypothetical protein ACRPMK_10155, partial [Streptococcus uberis]